MSGKLPLVSADSHVFEPATLWRERLPARYRDRGPRVVEAGGWHVLAVEGMPDRKLGRAGAAVPGGGAEGGIGTRLADLAHDGVVAEVVYPTLGLFIDMIPDPGLQVACAAVYNDWAAETFLGQPDVFVPVAVVPVRDVGLGVAELERAVGMGFRAAMIPTTPPEGTRYNQPVFDPLWEAAAGAGVPLSLHTGTGALPQSERGPGGAIINYAKVGLLSAETSVTWRRLACWSAIRASGSCSSRRGPAGSPTASSAWTRPTGSMPCGSTPSWPPRPRNTCGASAT